MFCHKCGAEIDDDAIFCKICGTPQNQALKHQEKKIKSSSKNSERYKLENSEPSELLKRFEIHLKTGVKGYDYKKLPEVWGILFSKLFISPKELMDAIRCGVHTLGEENVDMLRMFIKQDCTHGGKFVQDVIKKGGMIDRAALVMIADPHDLASIERDGTTAIHQLSVICDKRMRPELIRKFGKQFLSTLYDDKGMPALLLIFGLGDLRIHDLDAIGEVFSEDELKKVKVKSGMGKDGLEIFKEISRSINYMAILESTLSEIMPAETSTEEVPYARPQINSLVPNECVSSPTGEILSCSEPEPEEESLPDTPRVSGSEMPGPEESTAKSSKIMIVDDDDVILELLKIRLKILGYTRLYKAMNGDEAVILNHKVKPDIIFMDINMPGKIDGIDAAREIKNTSAHSQIIFLTGFCDAETVNRAKDISPVGYILKPFTDTDIRFTLSLI